MRVYLHEITEQGRSMDLTEADAWVAQAVAATDEAQLAQAPRPKSAAPVSAPKREVTVHLDLRRVEPVVVVSGDLRTTTRLLCSRCGDSFEQPIRTRFSALFSQDPIVAGVGHNEGRNYGWARHAHEEEDEFLSHMQEANQNVDITYLSTDFIELADVVREQTQLQIPFQPLCKEDCKGVCPRCGTDLNVGRCACAKLTEATPFSALRDFKV